MNWWRREEPIRLDRPIVCFGDSYTEGNGASDPRTESFPALLARNLGLPVVNAGRTGQTALDALPRLDRDVLRHRPRLCVVGFGVNEAFRGEPVARGIEGLRRILVALQEAGIPGLVWSVHFAHYQRDWDEALQELATKFGVDVVTGALDGVLDHAGLGDGYHPTAKGYALLEQRLRPHILRALALNPYP